MEIIKKKIVTKKAVEKGEELHFGTCSQQLKPKRNLYRKTWFKIAAIISIILIFCLIICSISYRRNLPFTYPLQRFVQLVRSNTHYLSQYIANPKPFMLSEDIVKEIQVERYLRPGAFKPPRVLTEDDVIHVIKAFNASFDNLTWRDRGATPQLIMTVTLKDGRKVSIVEMGMEFTIVFRKGDNSSAYLLTSPELKEIFQRFEEPEFAISEHPLDHLYIKGYITAIDPEIFYNWIRVLVTSSKDILYAPAGYFPDAYPAYWVNIPKAYRENFLIGHEIEVIFKDYLDSHQYPHLTAAQEVYFVQKEKPDGTSLTEQKAIELALNKIKLDVPVIKHVKFDKHQKIWLVAVLHGSVIDDPGFLIKIDDYSWEVEVMANDRSGGNS